VVGATGDEEAVGVTSLSEFLGSDGSATNVSSSCSTLISLWMFSFVRQLRLPLSGEELFYRYLGDI
jgi:hypothetical protein